MKMSYEKKKKELARKLHVKHEDTSKDEARLKMSKSTKHGETRFGGKSHF